MPREKKTRNPLGTILKKEVVRTQFVGGKEKKVKITVYDARKRYTKPDGSSAEKYKRCRTNAEAVTALTNFANEIVEEFQTISNIPKEKEFTFFELCEYFQKNYCKQAIFVGKRQISGYRQDYKKIVKYLDEFKEYFGDVLIADMTYEKIREFAEHLATTPTKARYGNESKAKLPAASTVNRKLAYLRRLFNIGIRARMVPSKINPFSEGEQLIQSKLETARERVLSYEEEQKLIAVCESDKWKIEYERYGKKIVSEIENPHKYLKLVIILAIDTGLRHNEIFKLQREDILFDDKIIFLPWKKTKALKDRYIPITERLEKELKDYFSKNFFRPKTELFFGQKSCRKAFTQALDRAGIKDFTFHDLRHTATTWMDEAGISQANKKSIVGHSSDAVHQRYHNLTPDIIDSIRRKMDDFQKNRASQEPSENVSQGAKILVLGKQ